jgi:formylglycine-generating enzyme required for sulfatase activity
MSYRGIENLWGNTWQWCDGLNVNDQQFYVGNDSSLFADETATGYDLLGDPAAASNGYIRNVQHRTLGDVPSDTTGNSSTAFADYYYQNPGWRVARVSVSSTAGTIAGPSCVSVNVSARVRDRSISGRLAIT